MVDGYLMHHGIKNQKWGVRRFQNEDGSYTEEGLQRRRELTNYGHEGGTIKKGSTLYRVSINKKDPARGRRKYVSTNEWDNALWEDNLIGGYRKKYPNLDMYGVKYKTIKDIKIAKQTEIGKVTCDILRKNPNIGKVTVYELMEKDPKNFEKIDFKNTTMVGTFSIRNSTRLGEEIVNEMMKSGYGGVADGLGYNVSNDPLIIFDPDKKMKKTSTVKYE